MIGVKAVILESIGRMVPLRTKEVHQRVVGTWGPITERSVCRHLAELVTFGAIERLEGGYVLRRTR